MSRRWTFIGECWEYPGYVRRDGYAIRSEYVGNKKWRGKYAHRWVYESLRGPIPEGMSIDHLCRNRRCCSPWHMEVVTPRENTLRGLAVSAVNAKKTHCKHGHEFSVENTYLVKDGSRSCRTCARLRRTRERATT